MSKKVNFNKELVDLIEKKTFPVAFRESITEEEVKKATEIEMKDGKEVKKVREDLLPRETVGTVLIACAVRYVADEPADGFYVKLLVDLIQDVKKDPRECELKEKLNRFVGKLIKESTLIRKGEAKKGIYASWVLAQVSEEMGVVPEGIDTRGEELRMIKPEAKPEVKK